MTGSWAGIVSSKLQSENANSNYWHNAVLVHHEQDWYCFSSVIVNVNGSDGIGLDVNNGGTFASIYVHLSIYVAYYLL